MQKENLIQTELSDEMKNLFADDVEGTNDESPVTITKDSLIKAATPEDFMDDDEAEEVEEVETTEETEEVETEETQEEVVEDKTSDIDSESISYKALLSVLNDEGLVTFEDSDDLEDNPDLVFNTVKKTIEEGINSYKDSIPDEGKQFLEYLENGGNPSKYFEALQKPIDFENIDLESEENQKLVIKEYLKTQDFTNEEIDETLNDLEESLLLEKQAKTYSKKLEKILEKNKEILIQKQAEEVAESQRQYTQYISELNKVIETSDSMAGLPLTKREKEDFRSYLLDRDRSGLTRYEKDLQDNSVKTQLELAYLKYKKYDFTAASKKGETAATQKFKNILRSKDNTVKGQSNRVDVSSGDKADFSAFKAFNS